MRFNSIDVSVYIICSPTCTPVHHTANTSLVLWVRTRPVAAVHITPKKLNKFKFNNYMISHFYPIPKILNYYSIVKS